MSAIRFSTSITLMFREHAFLERFQAARAAGFEGVEIQDLDEGEPEAMANAAEHAGVSVILVNAGMADFRGGGPGLSGVPGREAAFETAVRRAVVAAQALGASLVHVGPSRIPAGTSRAACLGVYRRNLETALRVVEGTRVGLTIEPLNSTDTPGVLLSDLDEAATVVRGLQSEQLGLQFDIYHTAMNAIDPCAAFDAHRSLIRHVQFSDAPGRHEPGTGQIDLAAAFAAIRASEYGGWVGAEYYPSQRTEETFGWLTTLGARFGR